MPRPNSFGIVPEQRVEPPADLPHPVKEVFLDLVCSTRADHFRPTDLPLIVAYSVAIVAERESMAEIRRSPTPLLIKAHREACQTMCQLASRLKISPSGRR